MTVSPLKGCQHRRFLVDALATQMAHGGQEATVRLCLDRLATHDVGIVRYRAGLLADWPQPGCTRCIGRNAPM